MEALAAVHFYPHYIGDWLKKTSDLTLIQEGVYRRLVDWCYANECALPPTVRDVRAIARARTPKECAAVQAVLDRYFVLGNDGWRNPRVVETLRLFLDKEPKAAAKREQDKERQRRSRERRAQSFNELRAAGVSPPFNATQDELQALARRHGVTLSVTRDEPVTQRHQNHNQTSDSVTSTPSLRDSGGAPDGPAGAAGARAPDLGPDVPTVQASAAGAACLAMRRAGLQAVNPADPRLHALLAAGVTAHELALVAAEASARQKGWAWALATVAGRRAEAARVAADWQAGGLGTGPPARPGGRLGADLERVATWTPALAAKAPKTPLIAPGPDDVIDAP